MARKPKLRKIAGTNGTKPKSVSGFLSRASFGFFFSRAGLQVFLLRADPPWRSAAPSSPPGRPSQNWMFFCAQPCSSFSGKRAKLFAQRGRVDENSEKRKPSMTGGYPSQSVRVEPRKALADRTCRWANSTWQGCGSELAPPSAERAPGTLANPTLSGRKKLHASKLLAGNGLNAAELAAALRS